jgi:hypothetical protein
MTLLDKLQAHKGGLIHIKSQLYWYGCGGWDNNPGRICLILDAARKSAVDGAADGAHRSATPADYVAAYFLIDGQLAWIWMTEQDIELLVNDPPTN